MSVKAQSYFQWISHQRHVEMPTLWSNCLRKLVRDVIWVRKGEVSKQKVTLKSWASSCVFSQLCLLSSFLFHWLSPVQFSHSVMSNYFRPHELQHARPPCPSQTSGVYSNSCPSSQWCHPAISSYVVPFSSCPQIPPSIRVFSSESTLLRRWPKFWSFIFNISPSNEHTGLISFRMNWLDLLAVQGTLKSLLQHHSSKALIFQCSAFFTVQLSHPYMTTGTTIALTKRTLLAK